MAAMADMPNMHERLAIRDLVPDQYRAMLQLDRTVREGGLEPALGELVKIRASQLNGCAYCLDRHTKDARRAGETEQRLYALSAWQEAPFFTARERAALALTDAMTLVSESHVPDAVYQETARHFSPTELATLMFAIAVINAWNRLAIAARTVPGTYRP